MFMTHPDFQDFADHTSSYERGRSRSYFLLREREEQIILPPTREGGACESVKLPMTDLYELDFGLFGPKRKQFLGNA